MAIYNSIDEYTAPGQGTSVALGFFDGVHLGHRAVIGAAADTQLPCTVLTFGQNPLRVLGRDCPPTLTDNSRKAELIAQAGANDIIFADFAQLKDMSPEDFVRKILHEKLNAKRVVCGFNYRFGCRGTGDTETLARLCSDCGIEVIVCEPVFYDGEQVSSSRIRGLIASGDIVRANAMLGCRYSISGDIGGGNQIGSALGFPTVNIPLHEDMAIPRRGVYASTLTVGGKSYLGATNIGVHPTVGETDSPICETFIIDYPGGDLYGSHAVCELCEFLRGERKFASVDELIAQIEQDCERIMKSGIEGTAPRFDL